MTRSEDERLLTGRGRYLDDLGHGAPAVVFVRSPHPHARIVDVDSTGARAVDGVIAIITFEDLPESIAAPLPQLEPHAALTQPRTSRPLAGGEVHHAGQPVVMIVAEDRYVAEDARDRVQVTYDPTPPVVGIEAARAANRLVHADVPGNIAGRFIQVHGDAAAVLATAPHTLTVQLDVERTASTPMEMRGVYAHPTDEGLRVYSATQTPASLRRLLADHLDLPESRLEVVAPDVGGGFGVKSVHPWPEEVLVAWAARRLDRPLKWVEDRKEHFASTHERGQLHKVRVAFDDVGRVLALDVRFWHDAGAYTPVGIRVPVNTANHLCGLYRIDAVRIECEVLYTTMPPVTPVRGAGKPQAMFVIERTMDAIAAHLGRDRAAVRGINLIRPVDLPYPGPIPHHGGDYPSALRQATDLVGWATIEARREAARARGRHLGVGLACYVERTGRGPCPYEGAHVRVDPDGAVHVFVGLTGQGQGQHTTLARIAAHELGVSPHWVHVTCGDIERFPFTPGTVASRSAVMAGSAVAIACHKVRNKALRAAAHQLACDIVDLDLRDGVVVSRSRPHDRLNLAAIARLCHPVLVQFAHDTGDLDDPLPLADGEHPGLAATAYYTAADSAVGYGVHAAVVEIDVATAGIEIVDYVAVTGCGTVIDPGIVDGQVLGGIAHGLGEALYERLPLDADGRLVTPTLTEYLLPSVAEIPPVRLARVPDHVCPANPIGVTGVGQAGTLPVLAVVASAIDDAVGLRIDRMPISRSELWEALGSNNTGSAV
ncbi:xanthine dehydrogenase family protein molybdopterin-binding subunit [Nocardia asteroides]|nr:xanthine dehydrogenase family protein molybdopterin-binding subunit [Nocardia asteroides]